MKRFIFSLSLILLAFVANAQQVQTLTDTLQGAETVNFSVINNTGSYGSLSFTLLNTELGGTADGTLTLQATNDLDAWEAIADSELVVFDTGASHTITDGSIWNIQLLNPAFRYYRIVGAGTSGDTTKVEISYYFRKQ